jgi:hypothetical protein
LGSVFNYPWGLTSLPPPDLVNGYHNLKAVVYDDVENKNEDSIIFNFFKQ